MIAPSIIALLPSRDESLYETATFFGISPMLGAAIYPRSPDRDSIATDCPQDCPTETSLEGVHLARLNNNSASPALPAAGGNDTLVARPCSSRSYSIFLPAAESSGSAASTPSIVVRALNASISTSAEELPLLPATPRSRTVAVVSLRTTLAMPLAPDGVTRVSTEMLMT